MHAYLDPAGFATLTDLEKRSIEQTIKKIVLDDHSYLIDISSSTLSSSTTINTLGEAKYEDNLNKTAIDIFNESVGKFNYEELQRDKSAKITIVSDIQNYRRYVLEFNSKHKPDITSALAFWRTYGHMFRVLGKVAKMLLSAPATSVPSESCFSTASFLGRKERSRLTDENLSSSIFLKDKVNL